MFPSKIFNGQWHYTTFDYFSDYDRKSSSSRQSIREEETPGLSGGHHGQKVLGGGMLCPNAPSFENQTVSNLMSDLESFPTSESRDAVDGAQLHSSNNSPKSQAAKSQQDPRYQLHTIDNR